MLGSRGVGAQGKNGDRGYAKWKVSAGRDGRGGGGATQGGGPGTGTGGGGGAIQDKNGTVHSSQCSTKLSGVIGSNVACATHKNRASEIIINGLCF